MTREEVKRILLDKGFSIKGEARLGNNTGWHLSLETKQVVNVFDNGTVSVQGKNAEPVQQLFGTATGPPRPAAPVSGRSVFVVYGHDKQARDQLEAMLRRWKLEPLFLDQLPSEGQTVIEKLEKYRSGASFGVVLATPDDEGHRAAHGDEKSFRVRQNVILELGMMLAILGRPKVAILLKDQQKIERPSDIQGLIYIPFKEHVQETAQALAKEMDSQGIRIEVRKL